MRENHIRKKCFTNSNVQNSEVKMWVLQSDTILSLIFLVRGSHQMKLIKQSWFGIAKIPLVNSYVDEPGFL